MKYKVFLFFIFLSQLSLAECPPVSERMNAMIHEHAQKVKGWEGCQFRDVFKDNGAEIVLYTIEGACYENEGQAGSCGNNYFRSMIGIVNGKEYLPVVVGGKFNFQTQKVSLQDGVISVEGFSHKKTDAFCCPTMPDVKTYKMGLSGFEEIKIFTERLQ